MESPKGCHMVLEVCASMPLVMLICAVPVAFLSFGLEYFPGWYRPVAIAELLEFALGAMLSGKVAQFFCMVLLAVGCPLFIGLVSQFSERFAESGGSVAAVIVVMAPLGIATISYVAGRASRGNRRELP